MVKDLPFAVAYLGDTFDLAQTNQPEAMDFPLQRTAMEGWACLYTWVYICTDTRKEKDTCNKAPICKHTNMHARRQYLQTHTD